MRSFGSVPSILKVIRGLIAPCCVAALLAIPSSARAQISMQALTTFGSNGWLQPSAFPGLTGTNNDIRSLAFNPVTGSLLYANASGVVPVDAVTGSIGSALASTGVSGGTKAFNTVAVTQDGVIYGSNLTIQSVTTPFRVYRWPSQSGTGTLLSSGSAGLNGARVGDDIAIGPGNDGSAILAFGFGSTPVVAGNNSFATVSTGSVGGVATAVSYTGGAAGDFRLGITFADADTVLGTQGSATIRRVSFLGASGTLDGSNTLNTSNERAIQYFSAYGTPLLATIVTGSVSGMNTVRLYNATNLATTGTATYLTQLNLATSSSNANANATGSLAVGTVNGVPTLYALNTNNGIQAFQIVPEPTTTLAAGACTAGLAALMLRRRRRSDESA
jgi:hypothetical protein